jgi:hypothetical protein
VSDILLGLDKLREKNHGDPLDCVVDNCIEYKVENRNPCDSGFVLGEYIETDPGSRNILDDVEIRAVKDINDEKYIYPINIRNFREFVGLSTNESALNFISEKALGHIQTGQAKLLIYYGYEGHSKYNGDCLLAHYDEFELKLLDKKISLDNVIYSDANTLLESSVGKIKFILSNYCVNTVNRYNNIHKRNLYHGPNKFSKENRKLWEESKKVIRDKYFLCYNRLPKSHRALTVLSLDIHNNLDKGIVSFPDYGMSSWDVVGREEDYLKSNHYGYLINDTDIESKYERGAGVLKKKLPLVLDKKDFTICHSINIYKISHYLKSYFTIVTENVFQPRVYDGDTVYFTEKIIKPIVNFHPFIVVGNAGYLKKLKELGFKTFEPFIDESYDDIDDVCERFLAVENEINKLCNKSLGELHEWYWSIENILKHNYYHFYKVVGPDEQKRFLNELKSCI